MVPLSHDEVVHGKSHLLHKMPGDDWQKYANTRALLSYMWTHPGKKTIFMGMEFGQRAEWNVWGDLQWDLLNYEPHKGIQRLVDDLNVLYKAEPALWRDDFDQFGFQWIDCNDNRHSVISFMRRESASGTWLVVVANFTPQSHSHYRVGVPTNRRMGHPRLRELLGSLPAAAEPDGVQARPETQPQGLDSGRFPADLTGLDERLFTPAPACCAR